MEKTSTDFRLNFSNKWYQQVMKIANKYQYARENIQNSGRLSNRNSTLEQNTSKILNQNTQTVIFV